jgi:hypothetical protein
VSDNRRVRLLLGLLVTVASVAGLSASAAGGAEVAACRAGDLSASVAFQGATGNLLGGLSVANHGPHACAIGGRPRLALFRADGRRVALVVRLGDRRLPAAKAVRVIAPAQSATAWILWDSYCGPLARRPFRFRATLTTGARLFARTPAGLGITCRTGKNRARLALTKFEPTR